MIAPGHPDAARARLRELVAAIEVEMTELSRLAAPANGEAPPSALHTAWAALVAALALGPEPELRACPVCHHLGMRQATRCGFCWTRTVPGAAS